MVFRPENDSGWNFSQSFKLVWKYIHVIEIILEKDKGKEYSPRIGKMRAN